MNPGGPSTLTAPPGQHSEAALRVQRALAQADLRRKKKRRRLTPYGIALFLVALLIAGSAFRVLRFEVGGLLLHPYLVPMMVLALLAGVPKMHRFPRFALQILAGFVTVMFLSTLPVGGGLGEMAKIIASALTLLTGALVVRNRKDFLAAVLGLSSAAAVLAIRGLTSGGVGTAAGINPLEEVANKNAFSLYALPPILLACFLAMEKETPRWMRLAYLGLSAVTVVAIFSSANRSGWLGVVAIAVLLYGRRHRLKATLFLAALGLMSYLLLTQYSSTETLEYRWEQTMGGIGSDQMRRDLFWTCVRLGFENPILGVGPQRLPVVLAQELHTQSPALDPHNAFGHVIAGSGLPAILLLLTFGWSLARRPRLLRRRHAHNEQTREAHNLLRMMILLWILRGLFSREILYSPAFSLGLGLCVGLCVLHDVWDRRALLRRWTEEASGAAPGP
jgi:hypothetical protein